MNRFNGVLAGLGVLAAIAVAIAGAAGAFAQGDETPEAESDAVGVTYTWSGDVTAPDFPPDADWINVSAPLSLEDLRGKIVLLDFWTYGCINCIHVIPDLKRLEAEYPDELVVVGVHSAKFENEGETENIRRVVRRYEVEHPVLNDNNFVTWQNYGVRAWPTFMLIDPFGKVVGQLSGEPLYNRIAPIIATMAHEYGAAGVLNTAPLPQLAPELATVEATPLRFPGKVLADAAGRRLFISDSNHNRIVVADLDSYEVLDVIGAGEPGLVDGDYASAQFFRPQGLALNGNTLYVADTENHAIRAVDLDARVVATLAGTGEQGFDWEASGPGTAIALNSPWDLTYHAGMLYIAMAGPHQLWAYDIAGGEVGPYAGNGREALVDGPLRQASMNQPSGIDTDGEVLYFADAEASAIRTADLDPEGEVRTIVGTGLFDFGDVDGTGDDVRLQHPLGVTVAEDGALYVADTYNNKIKRIDPAGRESATFLGTGEAGLADGAEAQFYEPGGLDYAEGKLYIADTNNDAIRVADVATGEVTTVEFPNVERLMPGEQPVETAATEEPVLSPFGGPGLGEEVETMAPQTVAPGEGTLRVELLMPEGYKLNDQAPFTLIVPEDDVVQAPAEGRDVRIVLPELPVEVPVTFHEGQTELALDVTTYWCEAINETLCFVDRATIVAPVSVSAASEGHTLTVERVLVPPVQ